MEDIASIITSQDNMMRVSWYNYPRLPWHVLIVKDWYQAVKKNDSDPFFYFF